MNSRNHGKLKAQIKFALFDCVDFSRDINFVPKKEFISHLLIESIGSSNL